MKLAETWLEKIKRWQALEEPSSVFHNVEDDEGAVALDFPGEDGTVYIFPDGSVAVVDRDENGYGDTEVRYFRSHKSLPALADYLTSRHAKLAKELQNKIQAVGDTYESAFAFTQAENAKKVYALPYTPPVTPKDATV